jgi:hypothetical protein
MIRAQALRILEGTNFQASNGWLTSGVSVFFTRRVTKSDRGLPSDAGSCQATAEAFLRDCEEFVEMEIRGIQIFDNFF